MVRWALTGETLLSIMEDDIEWPDEDRELFQCDILMYLKIPVASRAFYDLLPHGRPAMDCEEKVQFGEEYALYKRSCARCTFSQKQSDGGGE